MEWRGGVKKYLEELATKSTSTDQEQLEVTQLLLEVGAKDRDLAVVAGAFELGHADGLLGKALKRVEVEPLGDGVELARDLDHLLGHDTTDKGGHRVEVTASSEGQLGDEVLIDLLDLVGALIGVGVEVLGDLDDLGGVLGIAGLGQSRVLGLELVQRLEAKVQLLGTTELGKVGDHELARVLQRLTIGFLIECIALGRVSLPWKTRQAAGCREYVRRTRAPQP